MYMIYISSIYVVKTCFTQKYLVYYIETLRIWDMKIKIKMLEYNSW